MISRISVKNRNDDPSLADPTSGSIPELADKNANITMPSYVYRDYCMLRTALASFQVARQPRWLLTRSGRSTARPYIVQAAYEQPRDEWHGADCAPCRSPPEYRSRHPPCSRPGDHTSAIIPPIPCRRDLEEVVVGEPIYHVRRGAISPQLPGQCHARSY